jgi:hypothetical protein
MKASALSSCYAFIYYDYSHSNRLQGYLPYGEIVWGQLHVIPLCASSTHLTHQESRQKYYYNFFYCRISVYWTHLQQLLESQSGST